jgi:uncharacterized protein
MCSVCCPAAWRPRRSTAARVGLVPFYMRVAAPGGQRVPWVSNFCETNVRTFVRDREGRSGIWFFSLDAGSSAQVTASASKE